MAQELGKSPSEEESRDHIRNRAVWEAQSSIDQVRTYVASLRDADDRDAARSAAAGYFAALDDSRQSMSLLREIEDAEERVYRMIQVAAMFDEHHCVPEALDILGAVENDIRNRVAPRQIASFMLLLARRFETLNRRVTAEKCVRDAIRSATDYCDPFERDKIIADAALRLARWGDLQEARNILSQVTDASVRTASERKLKNLQSAD